MMKLHSNRKIKWIYFIILYVWFIPHSFSKEKLDKDLYLDKNIFNPELILPSPSQNDSVETKDEIEIVKTRMSKLNQRQKDLAIEDALNLSVIFLLTQFLDLILISYQRQSCSLKK